MKQGEKKHFSKEKHSLNSFDHLALAVSTLENPTPSPIYFSAGEIDETTYMN